MQHRFRRRLTSATPALVVMALCGILGVALLLSSHASTPATSLKPEAGTLGGSAQIVSDSTASNGSALRFSHQPTPTAAMLANLKLFNYFPTDHGWYRMWSEYDASEINQNFATMHAMGANGVRIIIQAGTFGYPTPNATMQQHLADIVTMAHANGLLVQLTLFDYFGLYSDYTGSDTWAKAVLAPYKNDSRIAFVEVQNELNPTDSSKIAWLQHMIPTIRSAAGNIPVTVSVTNAKDAVSGEGLNVAQSLAVLMPLLKNTPLDFYDVHYYNGPGPANYVLGQVRAEVGSAPVYVGETGISTWDAATASGVAQEVRQEMGLRTIELTARRYGFGTAGIWAFQDFQSGQVGASQDVGTYSAENFYGLIRADGSRKPAATSVQTMFATGAISTDINGDFTDYANGSPVDWFTQDSAEGTLSWDASTGHAANGSVKLSDTTGHSSAVPNYQTVPVANLTADGQTVTLSAWAKTASATGKNAINIDWFDSSRTYVSSSQSAAITGTNGWTKLTVAGTPPSGAVYFQISLQSADNTGAVWYDDVSVSVH